MKPGRLIALGTTPYLSRKPIQVFGPADPDLELSLMALYVDYAISHLDDRAGVLFTVWQAAIPLSIEFGRKMAGSGELRWMRESGMAASQAFNRLDQSLKSFRKGT